MGRGEEGGGTAHRSWGLDGPAARSGITVRGPCVWCWSAGPRPGPRTLWPLPGWGRGTRDSCQGVIRFRWSPLCAQVLLPSVWLAFIPGWPASVFIINHVLTKSLCSAPTSSIASYRLFQGRCSCPAQQEPHHSRPIQLFYMEQ